MTTLTEAAEFVRSQEAKAPLTPAQRVDRILAEAVGRDLSSWERHQFLPSVKQRQALSVKQEQCLANIEKSLFGGGK